MTMLFMICAVAGGTILLIQFALTMLGMGDFHLADTDVHLDLHTDIPHDFQGDAPADLHIDASGHDMAHVPHHDPFHLDHADVPDPGPNATIFQNLVGFKSLVAAIAFFGIAGWLATHSGYGSILASGIGLLSGFAAMVAVAWMMGMLSRLGEENTAQIEESVGKLAKVYLTVPPKRAGQGKVSVSVRDQIMEYLAVTPYESLATGSNVLVTDVVDPYTVEVVEAPAVEDV